MTVRDLLDELENYDDDMEVCIGMIQNYGSNWAYTICEVEPHNVSNLDTSDNKEHVVLTMGRQFGTVRYDEDEE